MYREFVQQNGAKKVSQALDILLQFAKWFPVDNEKSEPSANWAFGEIAKSYCWAGWWKNADFSTLKLVSLTTLTKW